LAGRWLVHHISSYLPLEDDMSTRHFNVQGSNICLYKSIVTSFRVDSRF